MIPAKRDNIDYQSSEKSQRRRTISGLWPLRKSFSKRTFIKSNILRSRLLPISSDRYVDPKSHISSRAASIQKLESYLLHLEPVKNSDDSGFRSLESDSGISGLSLSAIPSSVIRKKLSSLIHLRSTSNIKQSDDYIASRNPLETSTRKTPNLPFHLRRRTSAHLKGRIPMERRLLKRLSNLKGSSKIPLTRYSRRCAPLLESSWVDSSAKIESWLSEKVSQVNKGSIIPFVDIVETAVFRLPTHRWHAKRAVMARVEASCTFPFPSILPVHRNDIGSHGIIRWAREFATISRRGFSSQPRCFIHDLSFSGVVRMKGLPSALANLLSSLLGPNSRLQTFLNALQRPGLKGLSKSQRNRRRRLNRGVITTDSRESDRLGSEKPMGEFSSRYLESFDAVMYKKESFPFFPVAAVHIFPLSFSNSETSEFLMSYPLDKAISVFRVLNSAIGGKENASIEVIPVRGLSQFLLLGPGANEIFNYVLPGMPSVVLPVGLDQNHDGLHAFIQRFQVSSLTNQLSSSSSDPAHTWTEVLVSSAKRSSIYQSLRVLLPRDLAKKFFLSAVLKGARVISSYEVTALVPLLQLPQQHLPARASSPTPSPTASNIFIREPQFKGFRGDLRLKCSIVPSGCVKHLYPDLYPDSIAIPTPRTRISSVIRVKTAPSTNDELDASLRKRITMQKHFTSRLKQLAHNRSLGCFPSRFHWALLGRATPLSTVAASLCVIRNLSDSSNFWLARVPSSSSISVDFHKSQFATPSPHEVGQQLPTDLQHLQAAVSYFDIAKILEDAPSLSLSLVDDSHIHVLPAAVMFCGRGAATTGAWICAPSAEDIRDWTLSLETSRSSRSKKSVFVAGQANIAETEEDPTLALMLKKQQQKEGKRRSSSDILQDSFLNAVAENDLEEVVRPSSLLRDLSTPASWRGVVEPPLDYCRVEEAVQDVLKRAEADVCAKSSSTNFNVEELLETHYSSLSELLPESVPSRKIIGRVAVAAVDPSMARGVATAFVSAEAVAALVKIGCYFNAPNVDDAELEGDNISVLAKCQRKVMALLKNDGDPFYRPVFLSPLDLQC